MDSIQPHSGHLGFEGYKDLASNAEIKLGDGKEISFKNSNELTAESIKNTKKISFSYREAGDSISKNVSINVGRNTPLYHQLTQGERRPEEIKALVLKYITALLDVHKMGEEGVKEISAQFSRDKDCSRVFAGGKEIADESGKREYGLENKKVRTIREELTHLATSGKAEKIFRKSMQISSPKEIENPRENELQELQRAIASAQDDIEGLKKQALDAEVTSRDIEEAIKDRLGSLSKASIGEVGKLKEEILGEIRSLIQAKALEKEEKASKETEQPSSEFSEIPTESSALDLFDIEDATGVKKQGELQLAPGDHKIKILHGSKNGETIDLKIANPIYRFADAKFGKMSVSGNCLLMKKGDFDRIKDTIHSGAFGGDYSDLEDDWVAVWKIPADLKEIDSWKIPLEAMSNEVGRYSMVDDTNKFSEEASLPGNNTGNIPATKFRIDLPKTASGQPPSVHHLKLDDGSQVPGFSTGNLFKDFNNTVLEEREKTGVLLKELKEAGVKAFMCNGQHHLLVLYKDGNDQKMTPRDMADILRGATGGAIKAAFKKAAKVDFDVEEWAKSFISVYGKGEKGVKTSSVSKSAEVGAATEKNVIEDPLACLVTLNSHGSYFDKTFELPPDVYVMAPHPEGFKERYTLKSPPNGASFEEELYSGKDGFSQPSSGGWKVYKPGDLVQNIKFSPWSGSNDSKEEFERWKGEAGKQDYTLVPELEGGGRPPFALVPARSSKGKNYSKLEHEGHEKNKVKVFGRTDLESVLKNLREKQPTGPIILMPFTCNTIPGENDPSIHCHGAKKQAISEAFISQIEDAKRAKEQGEFLLDPGIHLSHLFQSSTEVKTGDGCTVCTFKNEKEANEFSELLEKIGIVGQGGKKKYVAKHVSGNPDFGVILTKSNMEKLHKEMKSSPFLGLDKEKAGELSMKLKTAVGDKSIGHYRNSSHVIHNLIKALEKYHTTGRLNEKIEVTMSHAMGSSNQPDSVFGTFHAALQDSHGGILQTIQEMKNENGEIEIAEIAQEVVDFLKKEPESATYS